MEEFNHYRMDKYLKCEKVEFRELGNWISGTQLLEEMKI